MTLTRVDVSVAAMHAGVSTSNLNKLRCHGGGPRYYKIGRRVVYDLADIDSWLASMQRSSTSDTGAGTTGESSSGVRGQAATRQPRTAFESVARSQDSQRGVRHG